MEPLTKPQLKYIRKESHQYKPLFQMGKQGLSEAFITQIDQALERRELIKFTLLANSDEDLNEVAETIAEAIQAYLIQVIGHTAILYRPSSQAKYQELSQKVNKI